jgi:HD-GYP domain-containing protein (c-di-GMP phosphodiesterase class II)
MSLYVNFRSVVHALSDCLDLVGINDVHHGKRVGIMSMEILSYLNWPQATREKVFDACLLHDIGVSSSDLHRQLVEEFDWEGAQGHAEFGAHLLSNFPPLAHLATPIRLHHVHWSDLQNRYDDDARIANLIFMADRVDVLAAVAMLKGELLDQVTSIRAAISDQAGKMFDPDWVTAFLSVSHKEAFWLALESEPVIHYMGILSQRAERIETSYDALIGAARLFSHVVDAKSRFTVEHSEGVARIAKYLSNLLAEELSLSADDLAKIELAAYLHDLGKLRVPDAILEKPGPLNASERRQISSHAYETYRILSRIPGFEDIARWAAYHHEIPDGEGYPFHLQGIEVPMPARILRASDIFQALAQERPYREGLPASVVMAHLQKLNDCGQMDTFLIDAITSHLDEIYQLSQPASKPL